MIGSLLALGLVTLADYGEPTTATATTTATAARSKPTPPASPSDAPSTRRTTTVRIGAGLGLGMRRPTWSGERTEALVRPSFAGQVWATPWIERPFGRELAIRVPLSYASTIGAVVDRRGPGIESQRGIRSHRLEVAADLLGALPSRSSRSSRPSRPSRELWLGGGLMGSYTGLDAAASASEPHHGFDWIAGRASVAISLARDRVWLGATPAIGVAVTGPRGQAAGLGRTGLGLGVSGWGHVRVWRRLSVTLRFAEQNVRWPGREDARSDRFRVLTAGLTIATGPDDERHRPRPTRTPPRDPSTEAKPAVEAPADASAPVPASAPRLTGTALDGQAIDLEALEGKVVIVDFWASWCGPCREAMPRLQALQDELGPRGLVIIGVSVDETEDEARAFAEAAGIQFVLLHDADQQIAATWQPPKMPTTYVIAPDGTIASVHAGYTSEEGARLRSEIEQLLGGGPKPPS